MCDRLDSRVGWERVGMEEGRDETAWNGGKKWKEELLSGGLKLLV